MNDISVKLATFTFYLYVFFQFYKKNTLYLSFFTNFAAHFLSNAYAELRSISPKI